MPEICTREWFRTDRRFPSDSVVIHKNVIIVSVEVFVFVDFFELTPSVCLRHKKDSNTTT